MKKIAYYGGSFDPIHRGHTEISAALTAAFGLDKFVFVPAFHAPHKSGRKPTSPFHRHAMLSLATRGNPKMFVSRLELEAPDRPYTIDTLSRILDENPSDQIFFVMGADSWDEITTWKEWESVLSIVDIIVVTRPGYAIREEHLTDAVRDRIRDLRSGRESHAPNTGGGEKRIYISDAVEADVSSTRIRKLIGHQGSGWESDLDDEIARYIRKYDLYHAPPSI